MFDFEFQGAASYRSLGAKVGACFLGVVHIVTARGLIRIPFLIFPFLFLCRRSLLVLVLVPSRASDAIVRCRQKLVCVVRCLDQHQHQHQSTVSCKL